jgi:asparagine N-glycosylation enzyme membrane subunit Stt3
VYKVFEVVPGAILRTVAPPGTRVVASVPVRTNVGRTFTWVGTATADAEGAVALRVPYATGRNGFVAAERYAVDVGGGTRLVSIDEEAVTGARRRPR